MIEHIEIEGFKSLEKVSLDLGALNIFVGTNASGKSNFLEALRVLQGIGYGYTVDEIFNGKPKGANSEVWEGIRGGSKYAGFLGRSVVQFRVRASLPSVAHPVHYAISISVKSGLVYSETLAVGDRVVFSPTTWEEAQDRSCLRREMLDKSFDAEPDSGGDAEIIEALYKHLMDLQALDSSPSIQREYSNASVANRMGDHAENFAALVKTILKDPVAASAYTSWLKELTPTELDEVIVLEGAKRDWLFGVKRNGIDYPADILSDGTLRFAAIAAAFFQPAPPHRLLLEEIEEGLHPTRLQLLVELLKSQTGHGIEQVIATSHSPYAIAWLKEEDYKHVFLCAKNDETGASTITPFSEVPHLIEVARRHPISDLFVQGWLETAV